MGLDDHDEGPGSETIEAVKPLVLKTPIVVDGQARAAIVSPLDAGYVSLATRVQKEIEDATGIRLPTLDDARISADDWKRQNTIALGNLMDSRFAERLYRMYYVYADARYPGTGGYVVRTVHDPWGTGTNVLFLGGSDLQGVEAATSHLLEMIEPGDELVVEPVLDVHLGARLERERFARPPDMDRLGPRLKDDSNRNLTRSAGDFGLYYALGGHPEWAIAFRDALYEHRSRPYMGWDDTHMELW
ncbi:MAG: hypothetical protein QGI83_00240 [Candidatus Latescibacteria bacterium]|jgi:hypothetical protein|nr:hypothetical protein [Candidatus Latescibacterota bacterium]